ncbi:hypothetical protein SteCoe_27303 [Stentor coeruleus]|uniref:Uncharacterized protein n=1 Tax=Stentor coeruleus TaxID=5963 RepID=A0A1R2BAU1_9CILI|nr:hypothetical protein SteCoe_27303 [Stentor coeruleus]
MEDSSSNMNLALNYLKIIVSSCRKLLKKSQSSGFVILNHIKKISSEKGWSNQMNPTHYDFFNELEANIKKLDFICIAPDVVEENNLLDSYILDELKNIDIVYILQYLFALITIPNLQENYESTINEILCLENIPSNYNSDMIINLHEEITCVKCQKNISVKTRFISQTFESELILSKIDQKLFLMAASRPNFKLNDTNVKTNCKNLEGKMFEIFTNYLENVKSICNVCESERVHKFTFDKTSKYFFLTLSWVAENINHQSAFISIISVSHNIQICNNKYIIKLLILRNRDGCIKVKNVRIKDENHWNLDGKKLNWNDVVIELIKNRYFVEAILYKKSKRKLEVSLNNYLETEKMVYECDLYEYHIGKTVNSDIDINKSNLSISQDGIVGVFQLT